MILPNNALTAQFTNYKIDLNIQRNQKIPKVTDVETEETKEIEDEIRKEAKEKEKIEKLNLEIKTLKTEMKLKDEEIQKAYNEKANEVER